MITSKKKGPVFFKESDRAQRQLDQLLTIDKSGLSDDLRKQLETEIRGISSGIQGENNIIFELRNSHMPMYILHDLYMEYEGLSAQIDFLVITSKINFVIECKNLYGNIEIDTDGNFIRTTQFNKISQKVGIYSPITQNQRHMEFLRQLLKDTKTNIITRAAFNKWFPDFYRSIIVLSNEKTILNDKRPKSSIQDQVIRADVLIAYIKNAILLSKDFNNTDIEMEKRAAFFLENHIEREVKIADKYYTSEVNSGQASNTATVPVCPKCGSIMKLRVARKGETVGQQFWGCVKYPKCRGSI